MKTLTPKRELIWDLVLIIIIIGLCFYIYIDSKNYNCKNCEVKFNTLEVVGIKMDLPQINVTANQMYDYLIEDKCKVIWDCNNGYLRQ